MTAVDGIGIFVIGVVAGLVIDRAYIRHVVRPWWPATGSEDFLPVGGTVAQTGEGVTAQHTSAPLKCGRCGDDYPFACHRPDCPRLET